MHANTISIPYGAIKSELPENKGVSLPKFQFLMVRLKEMIEIGKRIREVISIPYGAIKRGLTTSPVTLST